MSRNHRQPRSRGARKATCIEWIGGTAAMPAFVTDKGEPYRPEALFWLSANGSILGTTLARPGELLPLGSDRLHSTIEQPMFGRPHHPTRVRVASAEAKDIGDFYACRLMMDLAANYTGHTIATLGARDLRAVLFEIMPRKVSIEASAARGIIEASRAFYTFLKSEFELHQADACLRVLGSSAIRKLEAGLSDSSNFGMAKSLFMAGTDRGFDMQSKDDVETWMQSMQGTSLPPSIHLRDFPQPLSKQARKAKKDKRKTASKARRRNT